MNGCCGQSQVHSSLNDRRQHYPRVSSFRLEPPPPLPPTPSPLAGLPHPERQGRWEGAPCWNQGQTGLPPSTLDCRGAQRDVTSRLTLKAIDGLPTPKQLQRLSPLLLRCVQSTFTAISRLTAITTACGRESHKVCIPLPAQPLLSIRIPGQTVPSCSLPRMTSGRHLARTRDQISVSALLKQALRRSRKYRWRHNSFRASFRQESPTRQFA